MPDKAPSEEAQTEETLHPIESHPLIEIFGDNAETRVIAALLNHHPRPLNPASIANAADFDVSTWHRHKESLLEGIVEKQGHAGNSPLYGLPEDERTEKLEELRAFQGAHSRNEQELALYG